MRVRTSAALAGTVAVLLLTAACSSSSDTTEPAAETEQATDTNSEAPATEGKVGVILPDTESSARWESADRPYLENAFKEAGIEVVIQNAQGDASRMQTIADQMITEGVTVLAIVNL